MRRESQSMTDDSKSTATSQENEEKTDSAPFSGWLPAGLPKSVQRYGGVALVLGFALLIAFVMRNFSAGVVGNREDSLRATAEALALPTIESVTGGPAGSILPAYGGAGSDFAQGIPRLASMHTTIPTRPRVDLIDYEVQQGDNVFVIAENHGLRPESILWGNFAVLQDNPNFLKEGQLLQIMPTDGVLHDYKAGESLTAIAEFYNTSAVAIAEWPGNRLDPYDIDLENPGIPDGTALIVPGGSRLLRDWGPPAISRDNPAVAAYYGPGSCGAIGEGAIGNGSFVWPTVATTLSGFDYAPPIHNGIDIAGAEGNAIFAVDGGVVVYAGWSNSGYGNMLVIDHGTGWQSAYAHLSTIAVGCGTNISQGEVVAAVGNSGNSSGAHLHFELLSFVYGKVNPWNYLIQ